VAIPHPVGDPTREGEGDRAVRRQLLERALKAIMTPIEEQTVFTS